MQDVTIRDTAGKIYYLEPDNLKKFATVKLLSRSGDKLSINPLMLAAFNRDLMSPESCFGEEDSIIITEFSSEELQILVNFCHNAILPTTVTELSAHLYIFEAFGISLRNFVSGHENDIKFPDLLFRNKFQKSTTTTTTTTKDNFVTEHSSCFDDDTKDDIKKEIDEDPDFDENNFENFFEVDFDQEDEDDSYEMPTSTKKSRKRSKDQPKYSSSSSKKSSKSFYKSEIFDKRDDERARLANMVDFCTKFQQEFNGAVNVHFPSTEQGDWSLFETYELPLPIETYQKPPRKYNKEAHPEKSHPYKCDFCPRTVQSQQSCNFHMAKYHMNHYQCPYCERAAYSLDSVEMFRKHMFRHEHIFKNTKPHECIQCGYKGFDKKRLMVHMKGKGPFHNNQCCQCPEMFNSHQEYVEHVKNEHGGRWMFKCGQCEQIFDEKTQVNKHRVEAHNKKPQSQVCDICGKNIVSVEAHMKNNHDDSDKICPHCGKKFRKTKTFDAHIVEVHGKIPCELCGMLVAPRRRTQHFQQYHVEEKDRKFKCQTCGKGFAEASRLRDHINIHTGEKPYVCKICGAAFASRGNHRMHERGHMGHKRSKK